ncbi:hypothetical protein B0H63DRAFT_482620 [Podospora didyma]|uniref:Uncharacterized protein n=1 Tax=Podospora didyma TaxID=330526 RepID=A0AAE0KEN4_9PEZI|nr:hypothetical protein B0H63DRAFT_482620 [Podospora didyma]
MMDTATLQTPKSGRSRFSKALPTPPGGSSYLSFATRGSSFPHQQEQQLPQLPQLPPQLPQLQLQSQLPPLPPSASTPTTAVTRKQLPPIQTGPPLPPPKELEREIEESKQRVRDREREWEVTMALASPLNSPLPPLPLTSSARTAGLPPMAIPRRPVGGGGSASVVASPPSYSALPLVSVVSPAPPVLPSVSPQSELSPVGSLSSLLSAYSNHTSESTPRSSTNSANDINAKASYTTAPSGQPVRLDGPAATLPALPFEHNAQNQEYSTGGPWTSGAGDRELPPPPPLKDIQRRPTPPVLETSHQSQVGQSPTAGHTAYSPASYSPQQPGQLWRRRSQRSDKSLAVPELKLVSTNGSTAESTQNPSQSGLGNLDSQSQPRSLDQLASSRPAAKARVPLPRSSNANLPGRNIRPVASRQQIVSEEEKEENAETMGQKASKLDKGTKESSKHDETQTVPTYDGASQAPHKPLPIPTPSLPRLPTPEYETSDFKHPVLETIVSPLSPASSPELGVEAKSAEHQVRHVPSSSSLVPKRVPVGLPSSPAVNRDRAAKPRGQFSARSSSRPGDTSPAAIRRDLAGPGNMQGPNQREQPSLPQGIRAVSENGSTASVETLKPKPHLGNGNTSAPRVLPTGESATDETELTDHPGAALFPRNWYKPLPSDVVMDAQPLSDKNLRCLTNHRYMTSNRQRYNPIACRTCGHKDRNAECFICSACHLNVCVSCNHGLRMSKGDLKRLVHQIEEKKRTAAEKDGTAIKGRPDSDTVTPKAAEELALAIASDGR